MAFTDPERGREYQRQYNKRYKRALLLRRVAEHTGRVTCCGDCYRAVQREFMRKMRAEKQNRGEIKYGRV